MPADRHFPRLFENELFLIAAATRSDLVAKLDGLTSYLNRTECAPLPDIAFTLSGAYKKGMHCLSIIAATHSDLRQKMELARGQLQAETCRRIHEKSGIFFCEDKLGQDRLAFLFPGENAQYVNMLQDLCLHFPELRLVFDTANEACALVGDGFMPGALNFPPAGIKTMNQNEDELAQWEKAIALVHTANAAMIKLLRYLEIQPDAVVGHSFGELSAMEMAGILRPGNGKKRVKFLRDEYRHIKELAQSSDLPRGIFMTVGGVERSKIEKIVSRFGDTLCIAMENCPHQYVLCAAGKKMESAIARAEELLVNQGGICSRLPISRPYHTPFFEPAFPLQREFLEKVGVHPPEIDIYSCTSTDCFPDGSDAIIDLSAKYWMSPVRFEQTIERMHADGVRIFIDAGPRGNLCAFVSDILKNKPHLAVALNRPHRSDISQLNHVLGLLAAHGVHLSLEYLHARWNSRVVELNGTDSVVASATPRLVPIPICLPQMKADGIPSNIGTSDRQPPEDEPAEMSPGKTAVELNPDDEVMKAYLNTMDRFLSSQREVMLEVLKVDSSPLLPSDRETSGAAAIVHSGEDESNRFPLLGQVTEYVAQQSLEALRTYDVTEDLYLNDHSLGTRVSTTDPALGALPVMPLLMSLEIAAEAGAYLFPHRKVVAITDIRANRWIFLDTGKITLRTIAERRNEDAAGVHIAVALKEVNDSDPRAEFRPSMVEAVVVLADDYPPAPVSTAGELLEPTEVNWTATDIYPRRTFHGPIFQGIRQIHRMGTNGLEGRIETMPHSGLFGSQTNPSLCYDPLLVDSMGQAVWLWGSRELFSGQAYLPFSAEALRIFGPNLPPSTSLGFNLRVRSRDDQTVVTDLETIDRGGCVHAAIEGLCDRDFHITPALHRMIMQPVEHTFADIWDPPSGSLSRLNARLSFSLITEFPVEILETGYGVWRKALAFLILNPPEREQWQTLEDLRDKEVQWLLARAAVKDAVRHHLLEYAGQQLAPADICIGLNGQNQAVVTGGWKTDLSITPQVAVAGTAGMVAAVCGDGENGFVLGLESGLLCDPLPEFIERDLAAGDRMLLKRIDRQTQRLEWQLRLWCAKKAAAKAVHTMGHDDPPQLSVADIDTEEGLVVLQAAGEGQRHRPGAGDKTFAAVTIRKDNFVFGISTLAKEGIQ